MTAPQRRMPAEWEPQEAVWLAWPHHQADWPGKFAPVLWVFVEFVRLLCTRIRVRLIVKSRHAQEIALHLLERAGVNLDKLDWAIIPTDRVWLRDSGPTFVFQGQQKTLLDWQFNAWAKYDDWQRDDRVPRRIAAHLSLPRIQPTRTLNGVTRRVVLEGGAIDVNGRGTLLTTEECLLSETQCRNPSFTRADYEAVFADYLGVSHTIWLGSGIAGDDTHGHVDDLARFINPHTVVIASEIDTRDANYTVLKENRLRLNTACDQDGNLLTVVDLPMPPPIVFDGQRLPASYLNFLLSNGLALVPTFNAPEDRIALNILAELLPGYDIVGVYCGDLIWGLGALHCASQQEVSATIDYDRKSTMP